MGTFLDDDPGITEFGGIPFKGSGGGPGTPGGTTGGAPGGTYAAARRLPGGSFADARAPLGLSDILRRRRRMLLGLPGEPSDAGGGFAGGPAMVDRTGARGPLMVGLGPAGQGPVGPQGRPSLVPDELAASRPRFSPGSGIFGSGVFGRNTMQQAASRLPWGSTSGPSQWRGSAGGPGGVSGTGLFDEFGRSQAYNPNDPYAPFVNDPRSDINGLKNRILGLGGQAGAFDPLGGGAYMDALQQKLGVDAAGRQAQAGTAARYFAGSDPAAAGYASLASMLGGQSQDSETLNNARLEQMGRVQDWIRSILGGAPDYAQQLRLAQAQQPQQQGGGIGGLLGSLAGTGIGAYFGGPGGAQAGSSIGGNIGNQIR